MILAKFKWKAVIRGLFASSIGALALAGPARAGSVAKFLHEQAEVLFWFAFIQPMSKTAAPA